MNTLQEFFENASLDKVTEKLKENGIEFIENKEVENNGEE